MAFPALAAAALPLQPMELAGAYEDHTSGPEVALPDMSTASAVIFGMKSGLQPCIGCGLNEGCGFAGVPSGLRYCGIWLVNMGASAGSHTTILVSGRSLRSTRETPVSVPPVPNPVTQ